MVWHWQRDSKQKLRPPWDERCISVDSPGFQTTRIKKGSKTIALPQERNGLYGFWAEISTEPTWPPFRFDQIQSFGINSWTKKKGADPNVPERSADMHVASLNMSHELQNDWPIKRSQRDSLLLPRNVQLQAGCMLLKRKWESVPKTAWLCTIVTSFSKALANSHLKWTVDQIHHMPEANLEAVLFTSLGIQHCNA